MQHTLCHLRLPPQYGSGRSVLKKHISWWTEKGGKCLYSLSMLWQDR